MAEPMVSRKPMMMSRRRTDGDVVDKFYLKVEEVKNTETRQGPIAVAMRKNSKSVLRGGSSAQLPVEGEVRHTRSKSNSRAGSKAKPLPFEEFRARRRSSADAALGEFLKSGLLAEPKASPQKASLQRRATMPTLDLSSEALLLSRQLHLDFHEVKSAMKEVREGQRLPNGGMDETTWRKCLSKIFGIELEEKFLRDSYEQCKIADGEVDAKLFMSWYRDHIFNIEAHKLKSVQGDELTMELAKKHHCSFTDLTKVKLKFDSFDLDKSGVIDFWEFEHMIHQLLHCSTRSDLPKNRILRFWHEIDRDQNGTVDFQEFTDWYMKYFATAKQDGPVEAFYASFMPDFQRSHTLEAMQETAVRLDGKA